MKKTLVILLSSSIMLMTGCSNNPNNTGDHIANTIANSMQYISDYSYYNNGVAYTIGDSQNSTKTFLDFDSMERAPLCAVPNCTHNNSSCLSKNIGSLYKPVFYDGYVYYFQSNGGAVKETSDGPEFYMASKLMKASFNSSEVEMVCEFSDCVPREAGRYVLFDDELFFIGDDRASTLDGAGG